MIEQQQRKNNGTLLTPKYQSVPGIFPYNGKNWVLVW
jgi:hypothetical protein